MGTSIRLAKGTLVIIFAGVFLAGLANAAPSYRDHVLEKVHRFGSLNQVDQYNLHGDGDSECTVATQLEATILRDGSLASVEVITPSSVATFNNWSRWIFQQAAPFDSFGDYFTEEKNQYVLRYNVRMQGEMMWCGQRGKSCCSKLQLVAP